MIKRLYESKLYFINTKVMKFYLTCDIIVLST